MVANPREKAVSLPLTPITASHLAKFFAWSSGLICNISCLTDGADGMLSWSPRLTCHSHHLLVPLLSPLAGRARSTANCIIQCLFLIPSVLTQLPPRSVIPVPINRRRVSGKQMAVKHEIRYCPGYRIPCLGSSVSDDMNTRIKCLIVPE